MHEFQFNFINDHHTCIHIYSFFFIFCIHITVAIALCIFVLAISQPLHVQSIIFHWIVRLASHQWAHIVGMCKPWQWRRWFQNDNSYNKNVHSHTCKRALIRSQSRCLLLARRFAIININRLPPNEDMRKYICISIQYIDGKKESIPWAINSVCLLPMMVDWNRNMATQHTHTHMHK